MRNQDAIPAPHTLRSLLRTWCCVQPDGEKTQLAAPVSSLQRGLGQGQTVGRSPVWLLAFFAGCALSVAVDSQAQRLADQESRHPTPNGAFPRSGTSRLACRDVTSTAGSVRLRVVSGASFYRDDTLFYSRSGGGGGGRGVNIAVLNPYTGELDEIRHFDTWCLSETYIGPALRAFLERIPDGWLVMMAMADWSCYSAATQAILASRFGSQFAALTCGWDGWAMITTAGAHTSAAEQWFKYDGQAHQAEAAADVPLLVPPEHDPPTGDFTINAGAGLTLDPAVMLDLTGIQDAGAGTGPGSKMAFSNDGETWSEAVDFQPTRAWFLTRGSGERTVYGRFRDPLGNWSEPVTATIRLTEATALTPLLASSPYSLPGDICADGAGNVYAAFLDRGAVRVFGSHDGGREWPVEGVVVSPPGAYPGTPLVRCDTAGHVYVVWRASATEGSDVYFNGSADFGRTWRATAARVDSHAPGAAYSDWPNLVADGLGNVCVAWVDNGILSGDNAYRVHVNVSNDAGESWGASDVNLGTSATASSSPPVVAAVGGRLYVAWADLSLHLWLSHSLDAGVTWSPQPRLLSDRGRYGAVPSLVATPDGHVYVSWVTNYGVAFLASADQGLTWPADPTMIAQPTGELRGLQMAADASGRLYLAWLDQRRAYPAAHLFFSGHYDLFLNRSEDHGQTWLAEDVRLNTNDPVLTGSLGGNGVGLASIGSFTLAAAGNGLVAVAWEDQRQGVDWTSTGGAPPSRNATWRSDHVLRVSTDSGRTWFPREIRLDIHAPTPGYSRGEIRLALTADRKLVALWLDASDPAQTYLQIEARSFPRSPRRHLGR